MYPYLYRWCGILVIPGFFTTICTTNPFCTEYSCTDRVWVDWKSGGGKQVHKARARRERNRDKLSHFSKKTVAKRGGKGGRTSGAACPDSVRAHFRHFTAVFAADATLRSRICRVFVSGRPIMRSILIVDVFPFYLRIFASAT